MEKGEISSSSSIGRRRKVELPLIPCTDCKVRQVKALMARTEGNYGRWFYVCSSRKRDGSGCPFWHWEEAYEDLLMTNGHLPADYQPVFDIKIKKKEAKTKGVRTNLDGVRLDVGDLIVEKMNILIDIARGISLLLNVF